MIFRIGDRVVIQSDEKTEYGKILNGRTGIIVSISRFSSTEHTLDSEVDVKEIIEYDSAFAVQFDDWKRIRELGAPLHRCGGQLSTDSGWWFSRDEDSHYGCVIITKTKEKKVVFEL